MRAAFCVVVIGLSQLLFAQPPDETAELIQLEHRWLQASSNTTPPS
jgi:hypothetical protein